ncbi:hypothetical protein Pla110_44040 [Polystyrenella longa]|uniref:Holliday junction resolvase n=1 Tax=Polystyrenella longa TaxID=2528007 RepID=A0A518CTU0_9PLAN|nr:hypothetical protein [Polystyrenella longa]QDU82643.1 hypothetical protein Pla110_44040 [Polystyrenella longa]
MSINSRAKGKRAELALKNELNVIFGTDCRRGQQFCGASGDADVVGIEGVHIECKHVEALNIFEAMKQAERDARSGDTPIVCHTKNHKPWLVTLNLDELPDLVRKLAPFVD